MSGALKLLIGLVAVVVLAVGSLVIVKATKDASTQQADIPIPTEHLPECVVGIWHDADNDTYLRVRADGTYSWTNGAFSQSGYYRLVGDSFQMTNTYGEWSDYQAKITCDDSSMTYTIDNTLYLTRTPY